MNTALPSARGILALRRRALGAAVLTAAAVAAVPASASAYTNYFVATPANGGSDAAACTDLAHPCATLSGAIGKAADGDQIFVGPGSFAGATVNKSVRLRGAQAGVDARGRSVGAAAESVITSNLSITADDIVVDGFVVDGADRGIALDADTTGGVFENTILRNNHHGISDLATKSSWTARRDQFTDNNGGSASPAGVWSYGAGPVTVEDSSFSHNRNGDDGVAVNTNSTTGLTIARNTSDDDANFVATFGDQNLAIVDNVVTNLNATGIFMGGGNVDVDVSGNSFSTSSAAQFNGISLSEAFFDPESRGVSVTGNSFTGMSRGINLNPGTGTDYPYRGVLEVHGNRFANLSQVAIRNNLLSSVATIDATDNWFGCNAGPAAAACEGIDGSGTTTASPWLTLGVTAAPASILVGGDATTVQASFARNSNGAAVDPAEVAAIPVAFTTNLGTLDTAAATTTDGSAFSQLTSGATAGTATVTATADGQSATRAVTFAANAGPQGAQGQQGAAGQDGTAGTNGANGTNGSNGLPGQNAPAGQAENTNPIAVAASAKASKKRVVKLTVSCPKTASLCEGFLTVKSGRKTLARLAFLVHAGKKQALTFKLSAANLKALQKGKLSKTLSVATFSRNASGASVESSAKVKLAVPKK